VLVRIYKSFPTQKVTSIMIFIVKKINTFILFLSRYHNDALLACVINRYAESYLVKYIQRLMKFKIFTRMESSENMHRIISLTLNQWGENKFISLSKPTWTYI